MPGVTPKAEDATLDVTTTIVKECPDAVALNDKLAAQKASGALITYDVTCMVAPPAIDHDIDTEGEPT